MSTKWRRIAAMAFALMVSAVSSARAAGLVEEAVKHPFRTGAAVATGAVIYMNAKKAPGNGCSEDSSGLGQGSGSGCKDVADKPSLAEKADLLLLKAKTTKLRKNLAANGEKSSKGCAAHHLVPQEENRDWARDDVESARNVLDACGIGIDDALNGVYLPFNKDAECEGANHRKLHTKIYYSTVKALLATAAHNGCGEVEVRLNEIKAALRSNTFIGGVH